MTKYYPSNIKVTVNPEKGVIQEVGDVATFTFLSGTTVEFEGGALIAYTPENPGDWSNVPTNLVQAVDYLAAGSGSGGGGGGGTPGGSNGDIQYRVNATTFGGTSKIRFDGSNVFVTGSFLGNVEGTASYATSAGNALTASYVLNAVSASFATTALTASFVQNAVSSSYASSALTASYASNADLLDGLNSTAFTKLSGTNTYTGNQIVSGSVAINTSDVKALVIASEFDGEFLEVNTAGYSISLINPLSTNETLTLSPTDIALSDGTTSTANGSISSWSVTDTATANKISISVPGGIPTITSADGASNPYPINLSIDELAINSNPGNSGDVLTSQGLNMPPIWAAPVASAVSGSSKNIVYVAKNGSDTSVSGSVTSPFLTIQGAINYIESKRPSVYANDQDVAILVAPGTYSEDITFTKPFINVMGYVPTQYAKATQLRGLVNINNTSNPGGGTGQIFGLYNFLITPPTTASANVISFSGTGNGSLVIENTQVVGGGSNQSILYVSKSAAVATNCRVKARHSIFNVETAGSAGPTANIFNVYSVFESCEIAYNGGVSGGTVINSDTAVIEFTRGTLTAGTSNSIVGKITGSIASTMTVGDTAVIGTAGATEINGFLLTPGAYFISGKNAYSLPNSATKFVVSGSGGGTPSVFITAFDGLLTTGIFAGAYNTRISNTMTTLIASASFTKVT